MFWRKIAKKGTWVTSCHLMLNLPSTVTRHTAERTECLVSSVVPSWEGIRGFCCASTRLLFVHTWNTRCRHGARNTKDKALLERIQHRFTRMIPGFSKLGYEDRLLRLGLWSLEERRNRADLIEVYKILTGLSSSPSLRSMFVVQADSKTRGHSKKLYKQHSSCVARKHFFSERVINRWNSLSSEAVEAPSLNSFKNHFAKLRATQMSSFMDQ